MSRLVVWRAGARVGEVLRKSNGNLQFRYAPGYGGPPVSQALPLQDTAHGHRVTRAVFGGLLPEGDVRGALARNLGLSEGNDFGLLEEVGGDVAGAVSLLPDGVAPPTEPTTTPLDDEQLDALLGGLPQRPLAADAEGGVRLSLAGAQPKVPVILRRDGRMALPTNTAAPTTHILKPEPERFPGLVDNEAFCMELARACDLVVAPIRKTVTVTGNPYVIVERYDRELRADPIRRLHQEDFCQALGIAADKKYQQEGGRTVVQCTQLLRACTRVPARELPSFLGALAFNWIVGNCDAHGKNYSLLYGPSGPTLAPLYDVVSTVLYPELTVRLAMSIGGARQLHEVDVGAWTRLATDAHLRPAFVTETVEDLLRRAAAASRELAAAPPHDNDTARRIDERIQKLSAHGATE
ncbi:MAG: type II toxin-antitoxin system HipA family toxin [Gemmatimonadetes bacterium]|nr:type II toxin-antitoxin system HipA family toxin [Gemmatimonadota bacterium]